MKYVLIFSLILMVPDIWTVRSQASVKEMEAGAIRIMQLRRDGALRVRYPDALPSLLDLMNERSNARFDPDPMFIESLTDPRLFENPILYINCDELPSFDFSTEETAGHQKNIETATTSLPKPSRSSLQTTKNKGNCSTSPR